MKIYLICSVRNAQESETKKASDYVNELEKAGHIVHFPPRDVDQTDDGVGFSICTSHLNAMLGCDEVHVLWNPDSKGSHFDLGMAFMLAHFKPIRFFAKHAEKTTHKSYANVLLTLHHLTNR